MITSRHNLIESSWRQVIVRAGIASTRQPSLAEYSSAAERSRSARNATYGDILAMLPRRLTIADVSVIHPGGDTYVHAAATTAGSAAKTRDAQKYAHDSAAGSNVYQFVPLSHESYGRLGQPAHRFLNELANIASSTGAADKGGFVESALRELSIGLCRSNHRILSAYAAPYRQCPPPRPPCSHL
jgi:hypothetical protein